MKRARIIFLGSLLATCALAPGPFALGQTPAPNREIPPPKADEVARIDAALPAGARVAPKQPRLILLTGRTEGFYHTSIPAGLHAFRQMGERTGAFRVEIDHEMSAFTAENLKRFDGILFLSTTRLAFADPAARAALLDFVNNGKGVVGIHAASDNFPKWPEGQALMGGVFHGHPWVASDTVAVKLDEPDHPVNAAFCGCGFWINDEIYQITGPYGRDRQRVLMSLDMLRPQNERPADRLARKDGDFPIAWVKAQGKGRVFYSSLGHNAEVFWTPEVLEHWLDGIQFALGDLPAPMLPTSTVSPTPKPALAPALQQTLPELRAARADTALAFTPANLDAVATHADDRDPAALRRVSAALRDTSPAARTAQRKALSALAARKDLTPAAIAAVTDWLGDVGDEAAVPVLTSWARQPATADRAIRALHRIPGPRADAALIELLGTAPAAHRGSVAAALGQRRTARAAKPVAGLLTSTDAADVAVALDALGRIASKDAVASLTRFKAPAALAADRNWALIHAVLAIEGEGDTGRALKLAREIASRPDLAPAQRVSVMNARIRLEPVTALPAVQPLLADAWVGPRLSRAWLVAALQAPDSAKHLAALADGFASLPEPMQLTLMAHALQLGESRLAPLVRAALTAPSAAVRHAACAALATCGDLDDAPTLIAALGRPDDRAAATAALGRFRAAGLEPLLRAAVTGASPEVHAALLLILGSRLDGESVPLMVSAASGTETEPRSAGFSGLARLARGEDLTLVLLLRANLQPSDRKNWQTALNAAVRDRTDAAATISLLHQETEACTSADRPALIQAIASFEKPASTAVLRDMLGSEDTERRKEVVRVLAGMRNETSFDLLIGVAETDADRSVRTLALRGFLDTLALRSDRRTDAIKSYERAAKAALRQEERDAALAAITRNFTGPEAKAAIEKIKNLAPLTGS